MRRCPGRLLEGRADVARLMDAYVQYDARNVLPAAGGWLDQAAGFCTAVAIIDAERGRIERQRTEPDRGDRVLSEAKARTARYAAGA